MTDHAYIESCLPAYALGSLDGEDAKLVAFHLPGCKACRAQCHSYEVTVSLLAFGSPIVHPPDSLEKDLLHRITAKEMRDRRSQKHKFSWRSLFEWSKPAYAFASLLLIFFLSAGNILQWQQARDFDSPLKIIKMQGTPFAPDADGTLVIGQDQRHGVLVASDLPPITGNQQFQLWMTKNGKQISGGSFSTTAAGYGRLQVTSLFPLTEYEGFSITIEVFGGGLTPSTPELMHGLL